MAYRHQHFKQTILLALALYFNNVRIMVHGHTRRLTVVESCITTCSKHQTSDNYMLFHILQTVESQWVTNLTSTCAVRCLDPLHPISPPRGYCGGIHTGALLHRHAINISALISYSATVLN